MNPTLFPKNQQVFASQPLWDVATLLLATGGHLLGNMSNSVFGDICTDTRNIRKGDVFLALQGDRFDGHDFVSAAVKLGAAALIVSCDVPPVTPVPVVLVENTLQALGDLAAFRRLSLPSLQVMAITGSSGKTTVKEMAAAIFEKSCRVLKTIGNWNNQVGLPLSLLPVNSSYDVAVLEMGMNRPGEIARLTQIADPDIACITNVQKAHLEGLGDLDGVARAKGELFQGVNDLATLVVNIDDPKVYSLSEPFKNRKVLFGLGSNAEVRATHLRSLGEQGMVFTLHIGTEKCRISSKYPGVHNVRNSLAAAAIAVAAGLDIDTIAQGLGDGVPVAGRVEIVETQGGLKVINDTYNANPGSMAAALDVLQSLAGDKRKIAVLGDMLELGKETAAAHQALGKEAAEKGCDVLLAVGNFARKIIEGARETGMENSQAREVASKDEAVQLIKKLIVLGDLKEGDWILVKGSRAMGMESVVYGLQD